MLHAMEQIRCMRGGAQSHLMRCSDGRDHDLYYVVKFQNNPQHSRVGCPRNGTTTITTRWCGYFRGRARRILEPGSVLSAGEALPLLGFAVWVAKLRPMLQ